MPTFSDLHAVAASAVLEAADELSPVEQIFLEALF